MVFPIKVTATAASASAAASAAGPKFSPSPVSCVKRKAEHDAVACQSGYVPFRYYHSVV